MNKPLRIAAGLLVSVVCLWLVFRQVSFRDVAAAVNQSNKIWFLVLLGATVSGHILRSYRWQILLSPVKKVSAPKLFMLLTFGFLMNNVLPGRAGEVLRAYAANRETGIPTSTCLGSIALERLSDLTGLIFVAAIASTVFPVSKELMLKIALITGIGLFVATALFFLFQHHRKKTDTLPKPVKWVISFLENLTTGFTALKSPLKMTQVILLSFGIWFFEIIDVLVVARAFSLVLPYAHGAAVLSGIAVGVMIPAAPGYIGTYEFFGQQPLIFLGYSAALSLSLIFTLHVFQLVVNSLLGLPGFFKVGWNPRK